MLTNEKKQMINSLLLVLSSQPRDYRKNLKLQDFISDYHTVIKLETQKIKDQFLLMGINPIGLNKHLMEHIISELFSNHRGTYLFRYKTHQ